MSTHRIVLVCLVVLGMSGAALARPQSDGERAPAHRPLKDRACVADCRSETVACLRAARAEASPCFASCQPLVEAAREACMADPESEACELARRAARACLDPCNDILRPAVRACIAEGHACVRACPFVGEPPCITECRADHADCVARAQAALADCRAGCADELRAARQACGEDPESEACMTATRAAHACLRPCRERHANRVQTCHGALRKCVEGCAGD